MAFWRKNHRPRQGAVIRLPRSPRGPQENPYFQKRLQRHAIRLAPFVGGGLALSFLLAGTVALFTLPQLNIRDVKIDGYGRLAREDVDSVLQAYMNERVFFFFSRRNYLLFHAPEVRARLEHLPEVAGADVSKRFPQKATLRITERETAYQILTDDARVLADEHGRAFAIYLGEGGGEPAIIITATSTNFAAIASSTPEAASSTRRSLAATAHPFSTLVQILKKRSTTSTYTLYDTSNVAVQPGEEAVPSNIRLAYERVTQRLRDDLGITVIGGVFQRNVSAELRVVTSAGWYVILDPGFNIENALNNMVGVIKEKVRDPSRLQYIDIRYADRVYYK